MTPDEELVKRAKGRLGSVLKGKYRLDSILGFGGMAVVYRATHRNRAQLAVKMLHSELSVNADVRSRFCERDTPQIRSIIREPCSSSTTTWRKTVRRFS